MSGMEKMTRDETAEFFCINPRTLYRWVALGKVPSPVRFGMKNYWFKDSCEKALEFMKREAEKPMEAYCKRRHISTVI